MTKRKLNDVEKWLAYVEQQKSLGQSTIELATKVKEERTGKVFSDIEKTKVFEPFTKPISQMLKKALFIEGSDIDPITGQKRLFPLLGLTGSSDEGSVDIPKLIASRQGLIQDTPVIIEEIPELIDKDSTTFTKEDFIKLINLGLDGRGGILDYVPPTPTPSKKKKNVYGQFFGLNVNHKDFLNGNISLYNPDVPDEPIEIRDPNDKNKIMKLENVPIATPGLTALLLPVNTIEKYGLVDLITTDDVLMYRHLIKELEKYTKATIPRTGKKTQLIQYEGKKTDDGKKLEELFLFRNIPQEKTIIMASKVFKIPVDQINAVVYNEGLTANDAIEVLVGKAAEDNLDGEKERAIDYLTKTKGYILTEEQIKAIQGAKRDNIYAIARDITRFHIGSDEVAAKEGDAGFKLRQLTTITSEQLEQEKLNIEELKTNLAGFERTMAELETLKNKESTKQEKKEIAELSNILEKQMADSRSRIGQSETTIEKAIGTKELNDRHQELLQKARPEEMTKTIESVSQERDLYQTEMQALERQWKSLIDGLKVIDIMYDDIRVAELQARMTFIDHQVNHNKPILEEEIKRLKSDGVSINAEIAANKTQLVTEKKKSNINKLNAEINKLTNILKELNERRTVYKANLTQLTTKIGNYKKETVALVKFISPDNRDTIREQINNWEVGTVLKLNKEFKPTIVPPQVEPLTDKELDMLFEEATATDPEQARLAAEQARLAVEETEGPGPQDPGEAEGAGMKNKIKNKSSATYDKETLKKGMLKVRSKNGSLLINRKVDQDTIDLILKPYHHNKKYSDKAIKNYTDFVKVMGITNDPKLNKITNKSITIMTSPKDMLDKLELIIGSSQAGNTSQIMKNEGTAIIDQLVKMNLMTKEEHKQLWTKYFNI